MGAAGEGQMIAHQAKKMGGDALKTFRDRFQIPVSDADLPKVPFLRFAEDSVEAKYLRERREALGGYLPARRRTSEPLPVPPLSIFDALLKATGEGREISTTMSFVRILTALLRDKEIGPRVVPIVPDESRTFGMEGLFRQVGIFSQVGQLYRPQDADQLMFYREDSKGQILQEGISEPGAMASFIAAGTSYSTSNVPMIPFFIYYSMFGFQRFGDLAWAAGDIRTRGFLIGGTSGRTTLNGEGLQHEDGHSHVLASTVPNCVSYDPTYAYELAVIVHAGLKRMLADNEDVYYYITTLNENYPHPAMPEGVEEGILKGAYKLRDVLAKKRGGQTGLGVRLLGAGSMLREVEAAAELLAEEHGVPSEVWSVTSFTELRRDGLDVDRWNMLHPEAEPRVPYITGALAGGRGPIIASTDYMKVIADGVRPYVPARFKALGTDGFGRSDYRRRLRSFFEVDRYHVAVASLKALADDQLLPTKRVTEAIAQYGIDPDGPNPARS
jgi:pyruvate dehydrogenase E1 component